jgi:hypothetical protein
VVEWLQAVMHAQPTMAKEWGCYYQVTPALGPAAPLASWAVDCLHFGNDTAAGSFYGVLRAAFGCLMHECRGTRAAIAACEHLQSYVSDGC